MQFADSACKVIKRVTHYLWQQLQKLFETFKQIALSSNPNPQPVLRIHDILGWIRIRIRGSMPLTNGSGSFYFRHWPSRCQQENKFFNTIFSAYDFLKLHLHHFLKIKIHKESQNRRNQGFSYYFCMMIEGSGSGSWRSKNTWIRIRNTAPNSSSQSTAKNWISHKISRYSKSTSYYTWATPQKMFNLLRKGFQKTAIAAQKC